MYNIDLYSELLTDGFKNDPGILLQLKGLEKPLELFKAQCRGEIEAFSKRGFVNTYNDDGIIIGFSSRYMENEDYIQCLNESSKYLLEKASEKDIITMQNNAMKVASITKSDWYKKFTQNNEVFIIQVVVVKEEARGTGIFRRLITPILETCAQNNIPVALQTHNFDNVAKYEHLGFKLMEEILLKELNLTCYNLLKY